MLKKIKRDLKESGVSIRKYIETIKNRKKVKKIKKIDKNTKTSSYIDDGYITATKWGFVYDCSKIPTYLVERN